MVYLNEASHGGQKWAFAARGIMNIIRTSKRNLNRGEVIRIWAGTGPFDPVSLKSSLSMGDWKRFDDDDDVQFHVMTQAPDKVLQFMVNSYNMAVSTDSIKLVGTLNPVMPMIGYWMTLTGSL